MPAEAADGSYACFDGLHKSCSKCKQVRAGRCHAVQSGSVCSFVVHGLQ